jgi:hypothetical protein
MESESNGSRVYGNFTGISRKKRLGVLEGIGVPAADRSSLRTKDRDVRFCSSEPLLGSGGRVGSAARDGNSAYNMMGLRHEDLTVQK